MKKDAETIFMVLIHCEIGLYTTMYGPERAVVPISNIRKLAEGMTKYRARKALKELLDEGLIEYTSQGRPAVISSGETPELVYDAMPPINGYALTKKGFETKKWADEYAAWEKSMAIWANGPDATKEK